MAGVQLDYWPHNSGISAPTHLYDTASLNFSTWAHTLTQRRVSLGHFLELFCDRSSHEPENSLEPNLAPFWYLEKDRKRWKPLISHQELKQSLKPPRTPPASEHVVFG